MVGTSLIIMDSPLSTNFCLQAYFVTFVMHCYLIKKAFYTVSNTLRRYLRIGDTRNVLAAT